MSSNSVCNHTLDFVNHSYDYRQNWTPFSPITITNQSVGSRVERTKTVLMFK